MSIWCGWSTIGWEPACRAHWGDGRVTDEPGRFDRGEVRSYAQGFSNHYPDGTEEPPADVGIASIPSYCVPGHDEPDVDYEAVGPWLRLDVYAETTREDGPMFGSVVLDETAAEALRDDLTEWLAMDKARPREGA